LNPANDDSDLREQSVGFLNGEDFHFH